MPFVKGQSGNPGGRSREDKELQRLIDEKCPPEYFVTKLMDFVENSESPKVALGALVTLLERRYGKATQQIEHSGEVDTGLGALFESMIEYKKKLKLLA